MINELSDLFGHGIGCRREEFRIQADDTERSVLLGFEREDIDITLDVLSDHLRHDGDTGTTFDHSHSGLVI